MPLESGSSEGAFKRNVSTLMGEVGKSPHVQSRAQALAIAYSKQRAGRAEGGLTPPPSPSPSTDTKKPQDILDLQRMFNLFNYYVPKRVDGGAFSAGGYARGGLGGDPAVLIPLGDRERPRPRTGLAGDVPPLPILPDRSMSSAPGSAPWGGETGRGVPSIAPGMPPAITPLPRVGPGRLGMLREHYATGGLGRLGQSHLGAPQMGSIGRLASFGAGQIAKGIGLGGFKHHAEGGLSAGPDEGPDDDTDENTGTTLDDDCVHLVQSETPGRTDRIPMTARAGSYILPADVVSGLGQGNTAAGAKMWADVLKLHMPKPQSKMPPIPGYAAGGVDDSSDIVVAGGEVVVSPECVAAIGGGDPEAGKEVLNKAVLGVRQQVAEHNKNLPGPVK
jgi:hypothetical protein